MVEASQNLSSDSHLGEKLEVGIKLSLTKSQTVPQFVHFNICLQHIAQRIIIKRNKIEIRLIFFYFWLTFDFYTHLVSP